MRECSVDGCTKPHRAKGLCSSHYNAQDPNRHPRRERTCETCGTAYLTQRPDGRFCTMLCRDLWRVEQPTDSMWAIKRAPRSVIPRHHPSQWYGSSTPIEWRQCSHCSQPFPVRHGSGSLSHYCKPCRPRARELRRRTVRGARHALRRIDVFERDAYICWLCLTPCVPAAHVPHPLAPTLDHLVPRVHGGDHSLTNIATAHFQCNSTRGDRANVTHLPPPAAHAA